MKHSLSPPRVEVAGRQRVRWVVLLGATAMLCPPGALAAQTPDLSGTWELLEARSDIDPEVAYGGLAGNAAVPSRLYVTQARNGTLIVGSNTNTSRARTYRPGGESQAPLAGGEVTISSQWREGALVAEGRDAASGGGLREVLAMSADGDFLTVTLSLGGGAGERTSTLVYARTMVEPPCQEWATPCRDWSGETAEMVETAPP